MTDPVVSAGPRTEAAIALNGVGHDLMPGMRHDFGLFALDLLEKRGWTIVRAEVALRAAPEPPREVMAERLAAALFDNIPSIHRWMTVGWRETMQDEAVALAAKLIESALSESGKGETG